MHRECFYSSGSEVFVVCVLYESSTYIFVVIGCPSPAVCQVIGNGDGSGISAPHIQLLVQVFPRVGCNVIPEIC